MNSIQKLGFFLIQLFILQNINAQEFYPIPENLRYETSITEPLALRKGFFRAEVYSSFNSFSAYFNHEAKRTFLLENSMGFKSSGVSDYWIFTILNLSYGITEKWMVELGIPYLFGRSQFFNEFEVIPYNYSVKDNQTGELNGLGDFTIATGYQVLSKRNWYLYAYSGMIFPTGTEEKEIKEQDDNLTITADPTSNGEYIFSTGMVIKRIFYPIAMEIEPSFAYQFASKNWENSMFYSFNTRAGILLNDWFIVYNTCDFDFLLSREQKGNKELNINKELLSHSDRYLLTYGIKIQQQIKNFRLSQILAFPILGKDLFASMSIGMEVSLQF